MRDCSPLLIIFLIGLRFMAPLATEAKIIQHTIQLVPRLSEPTLVTAVLVQPNVPVKKGQPLFQFDRRPYENKVKQLEAQLAQAKQNVLVLKADTEVGGQKVAQIPPTGLRAVSAEALHRSGRKVAGPEEDAQKWKPPRWHPTRRPSKKRKPKSRAPNCTTPPRSTV